MADTVYSKKIFSVEVLPKDGDLENVVIRVQWEFQARNSTHYAVTVHRTELSSVSDAGNFVPFHELTEDMVLGWIESRVDTAALQAELDALILTEMQKPEVQKNPPWFDPNDNILTKLYVVVKDGGVIWGPARWNTQQMNEALAHHNVQEVLPNVVAVIPENVPTVINETTAVYQVHSHGHEDYNHVIERLTSEFLFEDFNGKAVLTRKKQSMELSQIKSELVAELQSKYFENTVFNKELEPHGKITVNYADMSELSTSLMLADENKIFRLKTDEDQIISLTKSEFSALLKECVEYYELERNSLNTAILQVNQCRSSEEILQVLPSLGL